MKAIHGDMGSTMRCRATGMERDEGGVRVRVRVWRTINGLTLRTASLNSLFFNFSLESVHRLHGNGFRLEERGASALCVCGESRDPAEESGHKA